MKKIRRLWRKTKRMVNPLFIHGIYDQNFPPMSVVRRIVISPNKEFVYIRIPKAANSTVTSHLWQCLHKKQTTSTKGIKKYKQSFPNANSTSIRQALIAKKNYFFFIIVRNPYDRVLSAYLNKFSTNRYLKRFGYDLANAGNGEINFKSFCYYLNKGGLYKNPHWIPQFDYVWPSTERINYIGKFENLNSDLSYIIDYIFGDCNIDLTKVYGPDQTKAANKRKEYYDRECKDIINKLYIKDFNFFGYEIE